jgi:probable HAF family extracellular repeat protein
MVVFMLILILGDVMFKFKMTIVVAILMMARGCFGGCSYEIVDLGTLEGGDSSRAYGISESGLVVGTSSTATSRYRAFLYKDGNMMGIGALDGSEADIAYDVNDSMQIVGLSNKKPFLYEDGVMKGIGDSGRARRISNSGHIVGVNNRHAFLYLNGQMKDIGILGQYDTFSVATGVNNHGEVTGQYNGLPFLYNDDGFMEAITGPDEYAGSISICDINDLGQIAVSSNGVVSLYEDGVVEYIDDPDTPYKFINDINNLEQIVGYYNGYVEGGAFLYEDGEFYSLNDCISPLSGWDLRNATSINDSGQIVGHGVFSNWNERAFLLNPIIEGISSGARKVPPAYEIPDFDGEDKEWGRLESFRGFDPKKNSVVIIHGWNTVSGAVQLPEWVYAMAAAMPSDLNVFAWNWQEVAYDTFPVPNNAQDFVPGEAINLSRALIEELGSDYEGGVHIIGHSLGAGVAARTTIYMQDKFRIDRLTLLDGPSGGDSEGVDSSVYLDRLLGQIDSDIFIKNYISSFGSYYAGSDNLSNYGLLPKFKGNDAPWMNHVWIHDWYTETVKNNASLKNSLSEWGYNRDTSLDSIHPWIQNGEFSFKEDNGLWITDAGAKPYHRPYYYTMVLLEPGSSKTETIISRDHIDFTSIGDVWEYNEVFTCFTGSPVYLMAEFLVPDGKTHLSFDVNMLKLHEGDRFELWIDDILLYSTYADVFNLKEWHSVSDIDLSRWAGKEIRLTFGLTTATDGIHSRMQIRNIGIYKNAPMSIFVPEPKSSALFFMPAILSGQVH